MSLKEKKPVKDKKVNSSSGVGFVVLHPEISNWRDEKTVDKKLASSIKETGLLEPIVARRLKDGSLEVFAGTRRFRSLQSLGYSGSQMIAEGLIRVFDNVSDVDAVVKALTENKDRKDLSPVEEARAFSSLIKLKLKVKDIAARLECTEHYVQERLNLLELPKEIQDRMVAGKIALGYGPSLLKLSKYPAAQKELAHTIQTGYGMNIDHAERAAKESLAEVVKLEQLRKKYGPCPKCGSVEIDVAERYGNAKKLKCSKCQFVYHGETKDPWMIYQIKEHSKKIGFKAEVTDGKVNLTPEEVAEIVEEKTQAVQTLEDPNLGRSGLTPEQMLMPLVKNDNVGSIVVEDDEVKLKLTESSGLHFSGVRKQYKTGEKSTVRIVEGWRSDEKIINRKPTVQHYLQKIEAEVKKQ